jgi:hypothetical protein
VTRSRAPHQSSIVTCRAAPGQLQPVRNPWPARSPGRNIGEEGSPCRLLRWVTPNKRKSRLGGRPLAFNLGCQSGSIRLLEPGTPSSSLLINLWLSHSSTARSGLIRHFLSLDHPDRPFFQLLSKPHIADDRESRLCNRLASWFRAIGLRFSGRSMPIAYRLGLPIHRHGSDQLESSYEHPQATSSTALHPVRNPWRQ